MDAPDFAHYGAGMAHRLTTLPVPASPLVRIICAFGDPAQGFAQVAAAAHKRDLERVLVDVVPSSAGVSTSCSSM